MCRIIRELEISLPDGDPVHVTISIGARLCRQADSLSDALSEADSALYAAKRTGRDRVVCASELVKSQQAAALAFGSDVAYSPPIRSAGG
jgi:predicted signal transduction protein with EAL and GGDEF domain